MVKKIKDEKKMIKEGEFKNKKEKNEYKDKTVKVSIKKNSVLHKNIKKNREIVKIQKNKKIKKKHDSKKINKEIDNNSKEEESEKNEKKIEEIDGNSEEKIDEEPENIEKEDEMEEIEEEEDVEDNDEQNNGKGKDNNNKEDLEEGEDEDENIEEKEEQEDMSEEKEEKDNDENIEEKEGQEDENEEKEEEDSKNIEVSDKEKDNDSKDEDESKEIKLLKNSIAEHYYTFQYPKDLYTLLYTCLIFKWIDTTKILILCNTPKEGYKIDIFLRQFRFNTIYLDKEMPLNTNNHFYSQYLKNTYQICIINLEYSEKSKNFAKDILNNTKVPITIIYFDCFSQSLLEYHSFHPNTRSIYHFISNKDSFLDAYENLNENINFNEFVFDKEQMEHLRYRAEDMLNGIRKSDIKKEKMRKINIELLHSKKMQKFFKENPKERENIIRNIEENTIKNFSPSVSFLPSYLIHSENNVIAEAIKKEYKDNKRSNKNRRRKKQKKMEQYFEALDKGDGSQNLIKF